MSTPTPISGFLLINKPSGPTSHDVVDCVRRITGERRVGHAGTLDPFASGLLIVGVGREATKKLGAFLKLDKRYLATLHLGAVSDTYDRTGTIRESNHELITTTEVIEKILSNFRGEITQIPPMYSAKKIGGKKLYELARAGKEIERKPQKVTIYELIMVRYSWPQLELDVHCSSGTYIRSLAHDIGQTLGVDAYLDKLTRTAIGSWILAQAVDLNHLTKDNALDHFRPLS